MSDTRLPASEISELIMAAIDGQATEEQFSQLNQLLEKDASLRKYYLEYVFVHVSIAEDISCLYDDESIARVSPKEDTIVFRDTVRKDLHDSAVRQAILEAEIRQLAQDSESKPAQAAPAHRFGRKELVRGLMRMAAMVLVAAAIILLDRQLYRQEKPEVLARLTGVDSCRWLGALTPLTSGSNLTAGPLELQQGLAELTFANGAKVILEAPARILLQKSNEIYLEHGKIAVVASGSAIGFAVNTDSSRVVDVGTEFGVAAAAGGETDVQVYQGEVALIPDWKKDSFKADEKLRVKLAKGQARRVHIDHSVVEISHNDLAFVRQEEFALRQRAKNGDAYARWRAWSYQLRRDPSLVVYYPFERNDLEPGTLFNQAAGTFGQMNGKLTTGEEFGAPPVWTEGRWPGKSALRFDRDKGSQVVTPADMDFCLTGDITIAVWAQSPGNRGGHILSNRDGFDVNYQVAWGRVSPTRSRLQFARYVTEEKGKAYTQKNLRLSEEWHLFVFTYDNNIARFYVDGELFESLPYEYSASKPVLTDLIIGAVPDSVPKDYSESRFNGLMDEIAIFRRILTPEEIQAMYNVGKPE